MLIEFSVANFRCFRERVTLSMEAEPRISERDKTVDARNVASTTQGNLLRVAGIYGPNASGKSNLLGAMRTLRALVFDSAREGQVGDYLPVDPFRLDLDTIDAPSEFEVVFVRDGTQLRYGLAATRQRVEREWLFACTPDDEEEQLWFQRERDVYMTGSGWQRDQSVERGTRAEALHLSVAATFDHPQAKNILEWFQGLRSISSANGFSDARTETTKLLGAPAYGEAIRTFVRGLDFGIDDLQVVQHPTTPAARPHSGPFQSAMMASENTLPYFTSKVLAIRGGVEFDLRRDESAGTIKAFELAGPLVKALVHGQLVIIDEFDARLHTLLTKQIIELFHDPQTNPHDAQLVFVSHDTNLLTRVLLRRDQLWFVEKSRKTHASDLYSLAEIRLDDGKSIRNDARYEKDYLRGKYGAIPLFGSLEALLDETRTERR